ncbi:multidrug effflux MFS transporter [Actinomadura algeriensis]|uniref:DHA1 family bicyclomycin/chloramphenicol resistance-like MFS transporter n=1 Tax=Actinomadura algeriensis TaxID=1679523 RepID=A0ABR9K3I2_9ACTN|nr:multidrug effflux MFS transporter [Actinomadura algeriensis]MBE1537409.1 DHA1 family bicyclomycin/chloramphenicol resistance-like MFS transporter [Actinomadura algeriensis]
MSQTPRRPDAASPAARAEPSGTSAAPPGSPAAPSAARGRFALIVVLGALTAIAPLSTDLYLPALPEVADDLSTGASPAQLTLTGCLIGLALGQAVAGPLSDALGRRRPLLAGMAIYAVASLLCAVAPTVETLIGARFVQGAAGAAGIVIARAVVRDLFEGVAAARFFSMLMLVTGIAPILAPVAGGQLLRIMPWPGVFAALSGIGVLLFFAALLGVRETLPPGERQTGGVRATLRTFRELLTDRPFTGYVLTLGLSFAAMFAYISGSPFVLQDVYGMSAQGFSIAFGVNSVGIMVAGQIGGRLAGRVPLGRLLRAGLGIVATGGVLLLVAVLADLGLAWVLPSMFLVAAGQGLVLPNATALALWGRPPRIAGSASALLGVGQFTMGGAAGPLAGVGGEDTAVPMAAAIGVLALLAVAVAAFAARADQSAAG